MFEQKCRTSANCPRPDHICEPYWSRDKGGKASELRPGEKNSTGALVEAVFGLEIPAVRPNR